MWNFRLVSIGVATMVALALQNWLVDRSAHAKDIVIRGGPAFAAPDGTVPSDQPNPEEPEFTERIRLPTDRSAERKIEEVVRLVNERQWSEAAQLLQIILDEPEDKFFKDERGRWVSVRNEANRILGTMPKDGVQFYEQKVGNDAKKALEVARKAGDPALLADVALRYMHTTAGAEAAMMLGTHHLDQGRYVVAALCFERLLQREGQLDKFNALMLFKALVAFERAGDRANFERAWPAFVRKLNDGSLPPALARMNPQQLRQLTVANDLFRPRDRYDWPMFGGDQVRTAVSEGGAPFLDPRWVKETTSAVTKPFIDRAFASPTTRSRAQLGGYHPIAVGGLMIYRSYKGLHAVNIKTGEEVWWFDSAVGLEQCARSRSGLDPTGQMDNWMQMYGSHTAYASVFYDNSLLGTLSTDNERVYLIEDIAVPPHPNFLQQLRWQPHFNLGRELMPWMSRNQLKAYDIEGERLAWVLGGEGGEGDPFNDTFFLGAPLPVGDKLYVLVEVNAQLQLLCLHPYKEKKGDSFEHKVALHWRHVLCDVEKRLLEDPMRRTQACHLAYSDGMMICPTNCGAVIAVDLLTRTTVWAKGYGEAAADSVGGGGRFPVKNPGYMGPANPITWSSSAPMIRDGKVVFTAPDGKAIYCLSLRNGDHLWSAAKTDNDLYLAGLFGKVALVVGKETCRAIDMETGKDAWGVSIEGPPSGRGVAANTDEGHIYYVPLKKGAVFAINLDSRATFISRSPKGEVPGNLIFHDGDVLSQGIYHVLAYPQLKVKEKQMNLALQQNPKDPFGLTERGELRLYQGKLEEALEDLTLAMANNPDETVARKARNKLYETLAGLLERHFTKYEPRIPELEELIAIPAAANEKPEDKVRRQEEERDRWARFHRMVAKGKEEQAFDKDKPQPEKLVEAFQAYLKFAGLGHTELIPIPEEPGTRVLPELWAQGRIQAMLARANEEQKKIIEESLRKEWEKTEKAGSVDALRAFVSLFGPVSEQGQKAKLLLAERLVAASEMLEAENKLWSLYQSDHERKSLIAAQALDLLARLYTRQGDLENATYYFGLLSKSYPKMVVRDGKTGDELYQELAMDKRFLAFLEGGSGVGGWVIGDKISVEQGVGNFQQQQIVWLLPVGEIPPSYRKYRLGMNMNSYPNVMARLVDRNKNDVKEFTMQGLRPNINFWDPRSHTPILVHFVGRTMVYQWGHWVYGFDPVQAKELWRYNTLGLLNPNANGQLGPNMYVYIQVQPNGVQELWYQDGSRERIGHLVMADANCACFLVKDEGLVAVDPSNGQKRWVKSDIAVGTEIFGDGEFLFMIPAEGGKPQVVRTLDGSQVPVEDFSKLYQRRVKTLGRNILVRETVGKTVVLRLYDIIAGADVWKKEFGADALLLNCLNPSLAGAVDAKGKVTVFRLDNGKEVLAAEVDPANIDPNARPQDVHLLEDGQHFYVVFNQTQKNDGKNRVIQPHGLLVRNVMVNGFIYAFDRTTGKEKWKRDVPAQQLAVDQFEDNPLLVFASWVQQFENQGNPPIPVARRQATSVMAIDKRNGEVVHEEARADRGLQQFHTLRLDPKNSVVELLTYNYKVVFKLNPEGKGGGASAPAPQPMEQPVRPPRRPLPIQPGIEIPGGQVEIDPAELRKIVDAIIRDQQGIDLKKMEELRRFREALEKEKAKPNQKEKGNEK